MPYFAPDLPRCGGANAGKENEGMKNLLAGIEEVLLMGPGPSCVPPQVYEAIGKKTLGHLDP